MMECRGVKRGRSQNEFNRMKSMKIYHATKVRGFENECCGCRKGIMKILRWLYLNGMTGEIKMAK